MVTIYQGDDTAQKVKDERLVEAVYFSLVRKKLSAVGKDGGREVFHLVDGVETNKEKAAVFSSDQRMWRRPTAEEAYGLLSQFANLSALARRLEVARNTVNAWMVRRPIGFYQWRYLLELVGAALPVEHRLEWAEPGMERRGGRPKNGRRKVSVLTP